jgi:esterase/lipase
MQTIKTKSFELAVYIKGELKSKKLALVLPGRLDTKDYSHMRSHVDYLSRKGYLAVSFDPPGTWGSSGDIKIYTMTNYLKAINEMIDYFGNKPTVLIGHSRGGSMAMLAGTQNKYVTHIIAIMSHSSGSKLKKGITKKGYITFRDDLKGGKKKFILPLNYYNDASKYNMLESLSHCNKPKLFVLGTKDNLVTPSSVRKTYDKSAEPKELYELNSDHDYKLYQDKIEEINNVIGRFLEKN